MLNILNSIILRFQLGISRYSDFESLEIQTIDIYRLQNGQDQGFNVIIISNIAKFYFNLSINYKTIITYD